ncbi:MAG: S8 family serine peptidase, partial [Dehalococcoidia bacterium]|nr:S8 family serine peptidase [Dehalococcoidia bacterium]
LTRSPSYGNIGKYHIGLKQAKEVKSMGGRKLRWIIIPAVVFALAFGLVGTALAQPVPQMVDVLIGFDREPGPAEQALVNRAGGTIKYTYHLVPAIAASLPEAAIKGLLRNPNVTSIEPDVKVYAIDTELDDSWGVKRIGAGAVHDGGNKGSGVKVAIIDSGIDYTHPDLDAYYADGYDFVNDDANPMDDYGHGTHCAGIVAAEDNDSGVVGVAPEASLYALKVLGADGSGSYSDVIAALQWAVDNGIEVTNNSYGSSGDPGETVKEAFAKSYTAGVLHVGAAGNSGNPPGRGDNVIYPARWDSVIAVGATDQGDKRARWSSTGTDLELVAPGVDIYSTLLGDTYGEKSGTSMSCPHVAGTAALVIAGEGLTNVEIRTRLQQTADDLGEAGFDTKYGYGLVDADEAAPAPAVGAPTVSITSPADGSTFHVNGFITFGGTASDTEDDDLTASLVWTSSIDGEIGTGGSFSTTLSEGQHTITASVTDSDGNTGSASISVAVVNDAPVVTILQPDDGATFDSGASITFEGTASDTEDDDLTASLVWTSSIDGEIGTGGSFSTTLLSDGNHTITAEVTDSGAKTGSSSISITVGAPSEPTTVSVSSITYDTEGGRYQDMHLLITVALIDDLGDPVAGASVSIDIILDSSFYGSGTGTTGTDGTVTFKANIAPSGTYSTTVTDVTAEGLTWDGGTPDNSYTK